MATIPRGPGASARRAEMMRQAWGHVSRHGETAVQRGSAVMGPVWGYITAHPVLPQGAYYLLTGVWPFLSIGTFLAVTGPKTDLWLVWTVGALIAVVGAVLFLAGVRRRLSLEIAVLAVGCACALMLVEATFVVERVISPVYLLDATAEAALLALWAYGWGKGRLAWSDRRPPVAAPAAAPPANVAPPR